MPKMLKEVFDLPDQPYHPRKFTVSLPIIWKDYCHSSADHEKQCEHFLNSEFIFASSGPGFVKIGQHHNHYNIGDRLATRTHSLCGYIGNWILNVGQIVLL